MFKVGDRVKIIFSTGSDWGRIGSDGVISRKAKDNKRWRIEFNTLDSAGDNYILLPDECLQLVNGNDKRGRPRTKPAPANFLLKYDLDEDPIEEYETMQQVKDRIKQLAERRDLKRDSIVVYEIKRKKVVSIETKIKFK